MQGKLPTGFRSPKLKIFQQYSSSDTTGIIQSCLPMKKNQERDMPTYKIGLARIYLITIKAENPESAKKLTETFIAESDLSTPDDRQEHKFTIDKIELEENDTFEC